VGRASGVLLEVPRRPLDAFREDGSGSGFIPLQADQSLRMAGVSRRAWEFAVSGYLVLYRWLAARNGEALDTALQRGMLDVAWRIEELLSLFNAADTVLERALARPLTRAALRLPEAGATRPMPVEARDDDEHEPPAKPIRRGRAPGARS